MPGFCLISTRFWKFHKINDLSEDIPNHKMNGIRGEKNAEKDHRPSHNYRKTASKKNKTSSATTHLTFNTGRPSVCPLVQFHPVPSGSRSNRHRRQAMPKKKHSLYFFSNDHLASHKYGHCIVVPSMAVAAAMVRC